MNFNNISQEELEKIIEIAREQGILKVCDGTTAKSTQAIPNKPLITKLKESLESESLKMYSSYEVVPKDKKTEIVKICMEYITSLNR